MLTKMSPIEYNAGVIVPGDLVVVSFRSQEDAGYKARKSSMIRRTIKYKAIVINVDLHCHYTIDGYAGSNKREKTTSAGLQSVYTSGDGCDREHRLLFVAPNFDVNKLTKACIYISTDSLSVIQINDIDIQVKREKELEIIAESKLAFVSTWAIKCGIATYTGFLVDAIKSVWDMDGKDVGKDVAKDIEIVSINKGLNVESVYAKLTHIQHEFGIMPSPPRVSKNSKCIITFHTVMTDVTDDGLGVDNLIGMGMGQEVGIAIGGKGGVGSGREMGMEFTLGRFESALNVAGYMVHNQESARTLKRWTKRDVWVIDHGSMYIPIIGKEDARKMLSMDKTYGININDDKIGFVFGFQSPNKNYKELVNVCKKIGMKLVISGARHERMNKDILGEGIVNERSIIFLNRFLTDMEVNLYALASDVLLFNYPRQDHYSVSGALHRTIGAGRPCILSNTRHFADVKEPDDGVLKFIPGDLGDLERKILEGLDKRDELGQKAREYADNTSWEKVAKRHLDIYSKYVKFEDKKEKEGEKEEERDNSSNSDSGDNSSEVVTNE